MPYKDPEKQKQYFRDLYKVRKDNPAYVAIRRAAGKRYRERHPERMARSYRTWGLKKKYDLTPEEFDQMFESQEGLCAICSRLLCRCESCNNPTSLRRPNIDHDHVTGTVRGILCRRCNTGIALLQESTGILENAIGYLEVA